MDSKQLMREMMDRYFVKVKNAIASGGSGGGLDSAAIYLASNFGVIGGEDRDETSNLNEALVTCGTMGGGTVVVKAREKGKPIRIDGAVQIRDSNVTLKFESPISYGALGMVRISGGLLEYKDPTLNRLLALATPSTTNANGMMVLPLRPGDGAYIKVGDKITVRGENDKFGYPIEKQVTTVMAVDGDTITCSSEPVVTYQPVYPNSEWEADWTTGTTVAIIVSSPLTSDQGLKNYLDVLDGSKFKPGMVVYIDDGRTEQDFLLPAATTLKSNCVMEIARVAKVVDNRLYFDRALLRTYLTEYRAGVSVMRAIHNSHIIAKDISWHTKQPNRRKEALGINYGEGCTITFGRMDGRFGRLGAAGRIGYSYNCWIRNTIVDGAAGFGSAEGYGLIVYYSTYCGLERNEVSGCRHNYLIQSSVNVDVAHNSSTDDYISGIDLHGANSIGCSVRFNRVSRSDNYAPDATKGGAIRNGNTSHVAGDHDTLIAGNIIEGYNNDAECAAIDVSPASRDVIIRDNIIRNTAVGVRHYPIKSTLPDKQVANKVTIEANTFDRVDRIFDIGQRDNSEWLEAIINNNQSINNVSHFEIQKIKKITMINNHVVSPVPTPGKYAVSLREVPDAYVTGTVQVGVARGIYLKSCPNAKIVRNMFDYTTEAIPFTDDGSNSGLIYEQNSVIGGSGGTVTVEVGTTTTGLPGTTAKVTNRGTPAALILDFVIPQGAAGTNGTNGTNGKSAYQIALDHGFVGTEAEWLASLKGEPGDSGGEGGGTKGADGDSAYQVWVKQGNTGTVDDYLTSLKGQDGTNGKSTYQLWLDEGNQGTEATFLESLKGTDGTNGTNGSSAYQVAVANGFVGSQETWLASLVGKDGINGTNGTNGINGEPGERGPQGIGAFARKTIAYLGDSVTGNAQSGTNWSDKVARLKGNGYITWADILSGSRLYFPYKWNFGVGGDNSTMVRARIADVIAAKPDYCVVETGGVDGKLGMTVQATIDNLTAIYDALAAENIFIIGVTMYPNQTPTDASRQHLAAVNNWVKAQRFIRNNFDLVDIAPAFTDFTTMDAPVKLTMDGTHPSVGGAFVIGKLLADKLKELEPRWVNPINYNPADIWNATTNPRGNIISNGYFKGTAGTLGANATGTVATGWTLETTDAAVTAVGSIEPHPEFVGLNRQVVKVSGSGTSATFSKFVALHTFVQLKDTPMSVIRGQAMDYRVEIEATDSANISGVSLEIAREPNLTKTPDFGVGEVNASSTKAGWETSTLMHAPSWKGTFSVPRQVIANSGAQGCFFIIKVYTIGNTAPFNGTIKVFAATAKVSEGPVLSNGADT